MSQSMTTAGENVLERLLLHHAGTIDRSAIQHALFEAMAAWPASTDEGWWKWLMEAGNSLELRLMILDLESREIVDLVRNGAVVVTRFTHAEKDSDTELNRIERINNRKVRFTSIGPHGQTHSVKLSYPGLHSRLKKGANQEPLRIVVSEPSMTASTLRNRTPFNRLMTLLKPESSEIWMVALYALVVGILMLATPIAVESLVNTLAFGRYLQPVLVLAVLLFGFLAFGAALKALQTWVVEIIQRRMFVRIAGELAQRLPRVTAETYDDNDPPELVNRFLDVVTIQKTVASLLLDAISIVLGTLLGMVVLAFYHPWLLGFDALLMLLMIFTLFILGRGAVGSSIKESKHKYRITAWLEEIAINPVTFRQEGGQEFARERADMLVVDYLTARKKHFSILMRQVMFSLFLQALASTALLGLGGWLVIQGQLTLGQLVAAELIVAIVVGAFTKMGKHLESYYDLLAAVDKIGSLFDLPVEKTTGILHLEHQGPALVTCRNLTGSVSGLQKLNLTVQRGEKVAIYGGDDNARKNLADLLFGLRFPKSGFVEIDGVTPGDLRPDILRHHVALVRDVEILTGSIADNIHLNRPGVTMGDIRTALRAVGLMEEINLLEQGLETHLTRAGNPLSRSQVQRLMIARAIVSTPRLLVIDGMLDFLADDRQEQVLSYLLRDDAPWTLLIMTGQKWIATHCQRAMSLADPIPEPKIPLTSTLKHE